MDEPVLPKRKANLTKNHLEKSSLVVGVWFWLVPLGESHVDAHDVQTLPLKIILHWSILILLLFGPREP